MSLAEAYRQACLTPSDINEHLPTLVDLAVDLDAQTIIELGTRGGVSTIAWLYATEQTGGHLWSVDIDPRPDLEHPNWSFIRGDDCSVDVYGQLPDSADVVFIDTSHAYDHTMRELNLYRWLVRPGGRIVLHDTELQHPEHVAPHPPFPVKKALSEFCAAEGLAWTNHTNCWGLGIVEVT